MVKSSNTVTVPEYTSLEIDMKLPMDFMLSLSFLHTRSEIFFFVLCVNLPTRLHLCKMYIKLDI